VHVLFLLFVCVACVVCEMYMCACVSSVCVVQVYDRNPVRVCVLFV